MKEETNNPGATSPLGLIAAEKPKGPPFFRISIIVTRDEMHYLRARAKQIRQAHPGCTVRARHVAAAMVSRCIESDRFAETSD